jgi:hypothetical protein
MILYMSVNFERVKCENHDYSQDVVIIYYLASLLCFSLISLFIYSFFVFPCMTIILSLIVTTCLIFFFIFFFFSKKQKSYS